MANYKVIQDIEAEDKIVGPLTLRQLIYAGIAAMLFYVSFIAASKGAGFLLVLFLPPGMFCAFFAFPWSREQPTEVWALAKIRFYLKPRRRIWDQSGVKELVTITVPKKIEHVFTDGLSQMEVKSRLNALASTIDSRGWAIKNVDASLYSRPGFLNQDQDSDRLIGITSMPQQVSNSDIAAADDMLDEQNSPLAQQFNQMMDASSAQHRRQIEARLQQPTTPPAVPANQSSPPADYWFLNQPAAPPPVPRGNTTFATPQVVIPGADDQAVGTHAAEPTAEEQALAEKLRAENSQPRPNYSHLKTIQPLDANGANIPAPAIVNEPISPPAQQPTASAMTPAPDPAKIDLARNNDLNVATIARLANKKDKPDDPNEVVISLR